MNLSSMRIVYPTDNFVNRHYFLNIFFLNAKSVM